MSKLKCSFDYENRELNMAKAVNWAVKHHKAVDFTKMQIQQTQMRMNNFWVQRAFSAMAWDTCWGCCGTRVRSLHECSLKDPKTRVEIASSLAPLGYFDHFDLKHPITIFTEYTILAVESYQLDDCFPPETFNESPVFRSGEYLTPVSVDGPSGKTDLQAALSWGWITAFIKIFTFWSMGNPGF